METDPRALRQQSDTPEAPASNSSSGSQAPESDDVAGRPHHSHPHDRAIKIVTNTRLAPAV